MGKRGANRLTFLGKEKFLTFVPAVAVVRIGGELGFLGRVLSITWARIGIGPGSSMPILRLQRNTCLRDGFGVVGVRLDHQVWCTCSTSLSGILPTG